MPKDERPNMVSEMAADVQSEALVGYDLAIGPVKVSESDDVAFLLEGFRDAVRAGTDARLVRCGETLSLWQRVSEFWEE